MAATAHLTSVAPDTERFTVQLAPARLPRRKPNAEYRSREHLTEREVERLIEVVKGNRWGHRDASMVLLGYRHGLRAEVEVLRRLRTGGQQVVRVEHVHVNDGGQAVIGNVQQQDTQVEERRTT